MFWSIQTEIRFRKYVSNWSYIWYIGISCNQEVPLFVFSSWSSLKAPLVSSYQITKLQRDCGRCAWNITRFSGKKQRTDRTPLCQSKKTLGKGLEGNPVLLLMSIEGYLYKLVMERSYSMDKTSIALHTCLNVWPCNAWLVVDYWSSLPLPQIGGSWNSC